MKMKYDTNKSFNACEILSLLLNQTMISIFNGSIHDSQNLIEGFCHFLQLMMHLINQYPEITHSINKEIISFKAGFTKKDIVSDIGVFMMKVFLVKHSYNDIKKCLIEEYFARQVFWMNKDHKLNHKESDANKRLTDTFKASRVSNSLYMFLYELFTSLITDEMLVKLDENYGLPSNGVVDRLKQQIHIIKNNLTNYYDFAKVTNLLDILQNPKITFDFLNNAVKKSNYNGYTKI